MCWSSLSHIQTATIVLASVFKNMSFEGRKSVNNVSVQQYYMYKKCVYNKSIELNHSSSVSYKNIFPSISHGTWISIAVRIWDFGFFSIRNTPCLLWSFLLLLNQPVLIVGRNAITVIKIKDFFMHSVTSWRNARFADGDRHRAFCNLPKHGWKLFFGLLHVALTRLQ